MFTNTSTVKKIGKERIEATMWLLENVKTFEQFKITQHE